MNTTIIIIIVGVIGVIYLIWFLHLLFTTFKMDKVQKETKKLHKYRIGDKCWYLNDVLVKIVAYKNEYAANNDPIYVVKAMEDFLKTKAGDIFDAAEAELE